MNTKTAITAVMLVSMTLVLAALAAVPAMNSPVFADGDDDDHKKCKLPNGNDYPGNKPQGCPPGLDKD